MSNPFYQLYFELLGKYGSPVKFWPQWCARRKSLREREIIAIGAILTQRASWHNAHLALVNLKKAKLLSLSGIGPETADTILLYVLDKPSFVIDEYTKRLVRKRGLANHFDYDFLKNLFEENLPKDVKIYQDLHALIIIEEKGGLGSVMEKV